MKEKELRRSLAVLPIGTVMKLTNLSARQIRYYEEQDLITPERNAGNRRMFSLNDVDRLLQIKDYLESGMTVHDIIALERKQSHRRQTELSDSAARQLLHADLMRSAGFDTTHSL